MESTPKLRQDEREVDRLLEVASRVVDRALAGAGELDAECVVRSGAHRTAKVRRQQAESIEEQSSRSLGLRLVRDGRTAMVSTNEFTDGGIAQVVRAAREMLELGDHDPLNTPMDAGRLCNPDALADLDLVDPSIASIQPADAVARAAAVEAAAQGRAGGVIGTDGATFRCGRSTIAYVLSRGFRGGYASSSVSAGVVAVAADAGGRTQRGAYSSTARHLSDLEPESAIGAQAVKKALAKLGAKSLPSCRVPVVFDRDAARAVVRSMSQCVLGSAAWRRTSYLATLLGERVASDLVTLVDDPLIPRGAGSRPFDGEGVASLRNEVVTRGVLRSFLCDSYTAKKLGRESTANAARGTSGGLSVSTSNFILLSGTETLEGMIRATPRGLLVTDLVGYGFNAVTGHFSLGAVGFWIEGGEITHPVHETTVAGSFDGLWKGVDAIGSAATLHSNSDSPPFRVAELTLGGSGGSENKGRQRQ